MKINARKLTAIMLVMIMSFSMVACQQAAEPAVEPEVVAEAAQEDVAATGDEEFTIVMVAKMDGIAWFDDVRRGVEQYGKDTPGVTSYQIAPETCDNAKQIAMVEDLIAQDVDAIIVIPNDPVAMKPVLQKARDAGIIVISNEASNISDVVDYDVEAFRNEDYGRMYGEKLAEAMGGKGQYAYQVGGLTMTTHMQWYDACTQYLQENYPEMVAISEEPFEDNNDMDTAYNKAMEVMAAYPDLKGYVGSGLGLGVGMALREKGRSDIALVSLGSPSEMGDLIKEGFIDYGMGWVPGDTAYVCCAIAHAMLTGQDPQTVAVDLPGYESLEFDGNIVYGNAITIWTADNVDDYGF